MRKKTTFVVASETHVQVVVLETHVLLLANQIALENCIKFDDSLFSVKTGGMKRKEKMFLYWRFTSLAVISIFLLAFGRISCMPIHNQLLGK